MLKLDELYTLKEEIDKNGKELAEILLCFEEFMNVRNFFGRTKIKEMSFSERLTCLNKVIGILEKFDAK